MIELFSLGNMYVSDFLQKDEQPRSQKSELKMMLDESTGIVGLSSFAPSSSLYGKYWYRSGTNQTMKKELRGIVDSVLEVFALKSGDLWIDIACNDGTLLSYLPADIFAVGIDPADDSFKAESEKHANLIIQDFFSAKTFRASSLGTMKAKIVTSIAMFYDVPDPRSFIQDIGEVLDDDGLWVLQMSYTPLMIEQLAFDNICHEHLYYYSLFNLKQMLNECGFDVMDVHLNDVNGGSFRVYAMKKEGDKSKFASQSYRDVASFRIRSILEYEKTLRMDSLITWSGFFNSINQLKEKTIEFIVSEKKKGKKVWGYGASTKGNTLLQYFGLDSSTIDGIAERSPYKFGLKTVGTNIPIYSEEDMRNAKPDYLLVLPWHFIHEFKEREGEFLERGGKFIVPCPKFEIIGK